MRELICVLLCWIPRFAVDIVAVCMAGAWGRWLCGCGCSFGPVRRLVFGVHFLFLFFSFFSLVRSKNKKPRGGAKSSAVCRREGLDWCVVLALLLTCHRRAESSAVALLPAVRVLAFFGHHGLQRQRRVRCRLGRLCLWKLLGNRHKQLCHVGVGLGAGLDEQAPVLFRVCLGRLLVPCNNC